MKTAIWHFFYRHWYDSKRAGHLRRATLWGWANDAACAVLWPRWGER